MQTQALTYLHNRVATDAMLEANPHELRLRANGSTYTMSSRAMSQLPDVLGMQKSRIAQLAGNGGIAIAEQVRGSEYRELAMTTTPSNVIVAFAKREPKPIDGTGMLSRLEAAGFQKNDIVVVDGRLSASIRTASEMLIGKTAYAHGVSLSVDLVGYEASAVATFLERLVCSNGAAINVLAENRGIPLHSTDEDINANNIDTHVRAWMKLGLPSGLMDRLRKAEEVPASLAEVRGLRSALVATAALYSQELGDESSSRKRTIADNAIDDMFGDFRSKHGVASLREIPAAQQHNLASQTSVLGLFNLGTELATHHLRRNPAGSGLKDWWNRLLSRSFDLEGVQTRPTNLPDFWLETSRARRASRN